MRVSYLKHSEGGCGDTIASILEHLNKVAYPQELQLAEAKRLLREMKQKHDSIELLLDTYHPARDINL